jgi:hypothetical protein
LDVARSDESIQNELVCWQLLLLLEKRRYGNALLAMDVTTIHKPDSIGTKAVSEISERGKTDFANGKLTQRARTTLP